MDLVLKHLLLLHLDDGSLFRLAGTCTSWRNYIISDEAFWKSRWFEYYLHLCEGAYVSKNFYFHCLYEHVHEVKKSLEWDIKMFKHVENYY